MPPPTDPPPDRTPNPPDRFGSGVFVLGMHRAGTSATAGALAMLGLSPGSEQGLKGATAVNPRGFFEQRTLIRFNDGLLESLAGSWNNPPDAGAVLDRLPEREEEARCVFREAFRASPWLLKDPRICLLLSFWRNALGDPSAAVLTLRDPLDIASSLATRDGFTSVFGLALWERYMHRLVPACAGLPLLVTRFDELVSAPDAWCRHATAFLAAHGVSTAPEGQARVAEFVAPNLIRERGPAQRAESSLSDSQSELQGLLESLVGSHDAFDPPDLPRETPYAELLFGEQRAFEEERRRMRADIKELKRRLKGARRSETASEAPDIRFRRRLWPWRQRTEGTEQKSGKCE